MACTLQPHAPCVWNDFDQFLSMLDWNKLIGCSVNDESWHGNGLQFFVSRTSKGNGSLVLEYRLDVDTPSMSKIIQSHLGNFLKINVFLPHCHEHFSNALPDQIFLTTTNPIF